MLHEEARWWRHVMDAIHPSLLYPMLNVGSSTEYFRSVQQPFIDIYLFRQARGEGHKVVHLDTKDDIGVDIVGDLTLESFQVRLAEMNFNSVFCSHLLEHVPEDARKPICSAMTRVLPKGGYLFVSCPRSFPYHPDPIDTRFRPTTEDLAQLFPGTLVVASKVVLGETYLRRLWGRPDRGAKEIAKLCLPFYKPNGWWVTLGYFAYLFRHFSSTCVVLRKRANA
jgi:Methyltransferase domain